MKNKIDMFNISEIKKMANLEKIEFEFADKQEKYNFIENILLESKYLTSNKKDKGIIKSFLSKATGLRDRQLKRLIGKARKGIKLKVDYSKLNKWKSKYTSSDIKLLVETDNVHKRMNGNAIRVNLKREFNLYGKKAYFSLAEISASSIYRYRKESIVYLNDSLTYTKTNPVNNLIGQRRKPNNDGKPGYLRIDSVHQGDRDKEKGVYYVNVVDEVTQWEYVGCVEGISEYFLLPVLLDLIESFPFKIVNFHSDNGSEYINYQVAGLLEKLAIDQTKSRSRRSNDNALVESKNASIVRKNFGFNHIPKRHADIIDTFLKEYFNTYINYHRVCAYPSVSIDKKGKEKKVYKDYNTPFRKFVSLEMFEIFLKEGITKESLFAKEMEMSDNESASAMRENYKRINIQIRKVEKDISGVILC